VLEVGVAENCCYALLVLLVFFDITGDQPWQKKLWPWILSKRIGGFRYAPPTLQFCLTGNRAIMPQNSSCLFQAYLKRSTKNRKERDVLLFKLWQQTF